MNAPGPARPPAAEVLGEAIALYGRHAPMLVPVAVAGALAGGLVGLAFSPASVAVVLVWSLFVASVVTGAQAPVWFMAVLARRGEPLTGPAVLYSLLAFGPRFFAVGLLFSLGSGSILLISVYYPAFSLPALPLLIYFVVLFSLATPAIVQERCTPLHALLRSLRLVQGNWWRTFLVQLPVVLFGIILVIVGGALASLIDSTVTDVVASGVALGVSAPLVALVETALYEEYSSVLPPPVEAGGEE